MRFLASLALLPVFLAAAGCEWNHVDPCLDSYQHTEALQVLPIGDGTFYVVEQRNHYAVPSSSTAVERLDHDGHSLWKKSFDSQRGATWAVLDGALLTQISGSPATALQPLDGSDQIVLPAPQGCVPTRVLPDGAVVGKSGSSMCAFIPGAAAPALVFSETLDELYHPYAHAPDGSWAIYDGGQLSRYDAGGAHLGSTPAATKLGGLANKVLRIAGAWLVVFEHSNEGTDILRVPDDGSSATTFFETRAHGAGVFDELRDAFVAGDRVGVVTDAGNLHLTLVDAASGAVQLEQDIGGRLVYYRGAFASDAGASQVVVSVESVGADGGFALVGPDGIHVHELGHRERVGALLPGGEPLVVDTSSTGQCSDRDRVGLFSSDGKSRWWAAPVAP
jgi:hypothetical protein